MPLRLPQPEGVRFPVRTHRPALAQVADDFIRLDWIIVDEPVEQRASWHQTVGEGTTGLHVPLARVEAGDPPQEHLLVLPPGDPFRWPGKDEGLTLRS